MSGCRCYGGVRVDISSGSLLSLTAVSGSPTTAILSALPHPAWTSISTSNASTPTTATGRGCVRTAARNAAMHRAHWTHEEEHGAAKRQMSRGCNYWHVKTAMPSIRKFL